MKFKIILLFLIFNTFLAYTQNITVNTLSQSQIKFRKSFSLALLQYTLGNQDSTIKLCKNIIKNYPNSAATHFLLGQAYEKNKNLESALTEYKLATEINKHNYWYKIFLANTLFKLGYTKDAAKLYHSVIDSVPMQNIYIKLINIYLSQNNIDSVEKISIKYINQFGLDQNIGISLLQIYLKQHDTTNALILLKKLIAIYPNEPYFISTLTNILIAQHKYNQALHIINNLKYLPSPNLKLLLIQIYLKKNSIDSAKNIAFEILNSKNSDIKIKNLAFDIISPYLSPHEQFTISKQMFLSNKTQLSCLNYTNQLLEHFFLDSAVNTLYTCVKVDSFYNFNLIQTLINLLIVTHNYKMLEKITYSLEQTYPNSPKLYAFSALAALMNNKITFAKKQLELAKIFDIDTLLKNYYPLFNIIYLTKTNHITKAEKILHKSLNNIKNNCYMLDLYFSFLMILPINVNELINYFNNCPNDIRTNLLLVLYYYNKKSYSKALKIINANPLLLNYSKIKNIYKQINSKHK